MARTKTGADERLLQTVITPYRLLYGFHLYPVAYCEEHDMVEYSIANTSFLLYPKGCRLGDGSRIVEHLAMQFNIRKTEVLLRLGKVWHSGYDKEYRGPQEVRGKK